MLDCIILCILMPVWMCMDEWDDLAVVCAVVSILFELEMRGLKRPGCLSEDIIFYS